MPISCLRMLYNDLILPNLIYGKSIWSVNNASTMKPLPILQEKIFRVIYHAAPLAHSTPLYKSLNILNLEQLNCYSRCNFIYKSLCSLNSFNMFNYPTNVYKTRMVADRQLQVGLAIRTISNVQLCTQG